MTKYLSLRSLNYQVVWLMGKQKKEAIENAEKAVHFWIKTANEDGIQIPEPKGRLTFA